MLYYDRSAILIELSITIDRTKLLAHLTNPSKKHTHHHYRQAPEVYRLEK